MIGECNFQVAGLAIMMMMIAGLDHWKNEWRNFDRKSTAWHFELLRAEGKAKAIVCPTGTFQSKQDCTLLGIIEWWLVAAAKSDYHYYCEFQGAGACVRITKGWTANCTHGGDNVSKTGSIIMWLCILADTNFSRVLIPSLFKIDFFLGRSNNNKSLC